MEQQYLKEIRMFKDNFNRNVMSLMVSVNQIIKVISFNQIPQKFLCNRYSVVSRIMSPASEASLADVSNGRSDAKQSVAEAVLLDKLSFVFILKFCILTPVFFFVEACMFSLLYMTLCTISC